MSAPSTCSLGLTYFQDLAAGPGVDGAWTIEQLSGADTIIQSGGFYLRTTDADTAAFANLDDLKTLTQTLGGTPTIIQADLTVVNNNVDGGISVTGSGQMTGIARMYSTSGANRSIGLEFSNHNTGLDVDCIVHLVVRSSTDAVLFNGSLDTFSFNLLGAFPQNHTYGGTIKIVQVAGNNVEVYWNGVLKYTTVNGEFAMDPSVKIALSRVTDAHQSQYGEVQNISYVGPSGLGTDCPNDAFSDAAVSSRGNLSASSGAGAAPDAAVSSRGNLYADSTPDFQGDFPTKALFVEGQLCLRGESQDVITASMNDYDPDEGRACTVVNFTASGGNWNVTGLVGGEKNRVMLLRNDGGSNNIVLKDGSALSATENRFDFGGDVTLTPGDSCLIIYTQSLLKWKKFPSP